jgi:hypothetical protein
MPPCSNYGVAHVFVFGGVSMRPVSIADRLRGSSIVGVAVGSFGLALSVRQTLSLSSANTRKFSAARMLLLLGITHWEQLGADLTGIQTLQIMLNCMRGVWAVEVEQERGIRIRIHQCAPI